MPVNTLKYVNGVHKEIVSTDSIYGIVPAGVIYSFAGGSAPTGWLICDGASYPTASYPDLFAIIGYTYGGSGANFNVPDITTRVPVGYKSGDADFGALNQKAGVKTVTIDLASMASHSHYNPAPDVLDYRTGWISVDHTHNYLHQNMAFAYYPGGNWAPYYWYGTYTGTVSADHSHTISNNGGNGAHNNLQPYITLHYIIKY